MPRNLRTNDHVPTILAHLTRYGDMTATQLADQDAIELTRSSISDILNQLHDAGLVKHSRTHTAGRSQYYQATIDGERFMRLRVRIDAQLGASGRE